MFWLSYGGGVNSTALAILLVRGRLPQYVPFRLVFADTHNERDHTYQFISQSFGPWLRERGFDIEIVSDVESVLSRWERYGCVGSRRLRSCTDHAKIRPINQHIESHGGGIRLVGIDAGETNRAVTRCGFLYPLVELGLDRDDCAEIIRGVGLPVPGKSGCWCCPFLRVQEIFGLARLYPCQLARIERLEALATARKGKPRYQWSNKPVAYWRERAKTGVVLSSDFDIVMPCECYDG